MAERQGGESDEADEAGGSHPGVTVVGEPGTPKKKGAKTGAKLDARKMPTPIDFRAIPAGNVSRPFEGWEPAAKKTNKKKSKRKTGL